MQAGEAPSSFFLLPTCGLTGARWLLPVLRESLLVLEAKAGGLAGESKREMARNIYLDVCVI